MRMEILSIDSLRGPPCAATSNRIATRRVRSICNCRVAGCYFGNLDNLVVFSEAKEIMQVFGASVLGDPSILLPGIATDCSRPLV